MPNDKKWYLPDENSNEPRGPFTTSEIVAMIEDGQLSFDGYIWTESFGTDWESIHKVVEFYESFNRRLPAKPNFNPPSVANAVEVLLENEQHEHLAKPEELEMLALIESYSIENIYRRFPRMPYEASVILHNHKKAFVFKTIDISEKGISVKVDRNFIFHPSDEVIITVRNFPELGTFSAHAVVLREFLIDGNIVLGFYFMHLNPKIRRAIAHYVQVKSREIIAEQRAV